MSQVELLVYEGFHYAASGPTLIIGSEWRIRNDGDLVRDLHAACNP